MSDVSRRAFMKTAGLATGTLLASSVSTRSYGANSRIRLGIIGTGGQGCRHIDHGIPGTPELHLVSCCDVYRPHRTGAKKLAGVNLSEGEAQALRIYPGDYREMLDRETLDAVVIATPTLLHESMTMECLDRGLHVFCEKCPATTIKGARAVVKKVHETGRIYQVGHQRRYNPIYNTAVWLTRKGSNFGRIHHVSAHWHLNHDWRRYVDPKYTMDETESKFIGDLNRHLNWRLYRECGGGLMTELGTHQTDVATWFLGTPPSRVVGYAGRDYWYDDRDTYDNLSVVFEYDIARSAGSFQPPQPRTEYQDPWLMTKPYQVRLDYNITFANAKQGAAEFILGDNGTLELTEHEGGRLFAETRPLRDRRDLLFAKLSRDERDRLPMTLDGHKYVPITSSKSRAPRSMYTEGVPIQILEEAGGDRLATIDMRRIDADQFRAFAKDIMDNTTPKANEMVGLLATVSAVAAQRALDERTAVEIDPAWYAFDFDTPNPYRYDRAPTPQLHENCTDAFPMPTISLES